ncbi:MAG: molecular chaperone DnaJ [Myxococcaceae bacterium]
MGYEAPMAKSRQPQKNAGSARMKAAWKLLDDGDVVAARREARRLGEHPESPEDVDEARALLERTEIPKQAFLLAGAAAATYVFLVLLAVARSA